MSFRWKLFFSYMTLALIMAGAFFLYSNHVLEQRMVDESREGLLNQARLVRTLVEREGGLHSSPQALAQRIGLEISARVTLIAPDGRVLGESGVPDEQLAGIENHLNRPEVRQALAAADGYGSSVRYSNTVKMKMLYTALRCRMGETDGVVRLALPLTHLEQTRGALHRMLGGAVAVLLLLALALSAILAALSTRPLREMAEAAARIGVGEQGVRVPQIDRGEMGYLARVLNEMAARIEGQVRSLAAEQRRLDSILRGMGEGVIVLDQRGIITLVNPAFRRQFALAGDVEGRHLAEVCRHPELLRAFEEHLASGEELHSEVTLPPTGLVLLAHWEPLAGDGGGRQGVVAVFHDITDMKRVENMRRDFVANVSHELRTPVSVIKGYAETLLDGALVADSGRALRFVEIIHSHSERLATLINDILTLSKLESKDTVLDLHPLDAAGTMSKACLLLEQNANRKHISLALDFQEGLPRVMADQGRLEQVLMNLLDNAIKYTPEQGRVTLSARRDEGSAMVRISVADSGIGIPLKDMPRIFERFYRVDEARSREQGGTGLGLAIVKHIVQLHGGEISVVSEPGKGSTFSFTLKASA